ncbi:MAG TPA: SMP-30/gluconolactonase/LRE family protein [Lacipirellulaceae bacterium]|nr:SMP-30/gluconolactonase/LRE family protein [Lacipirellulaceae bacterium]
MFEPQVRPRSAPLALAVLILMGTVLQIRHAPAADQSPTTVGHIERLDPAFDKLVPPGAKIEVISDGNAWCEGPLWVPSGGFLLWSNIPNNAIMRWDPKSGVSLFLKPSGYTGTQPRGGESGSNGLTLDRQGRLILCQHGDRRIARLDAPWNNPRPKFVTLADRYQGKRFNSPNDVIVDSRGAIYFTDPPYGLEKGLDDPKRELSFYGVYRIAPDGKLKLLTADLERPNGIALSPDEKTLYVSNSDEKRQVIMAYPLNADGTLSRGRVFFDATAVAAKPGACDGLAIDTHGNLFATIPGGIGVFTPRGKQLALIDTADRTGNCKFGEDGSTLFIAANHRILRIRTTTKGAGF